MNEHCRLSSDGSTSPTENLRSVLQAVTIKKYISERLEIYKQQLAPKEVVFNKDCEATKKVALQAISACTSRPWRKKHRFWLICDLALILLDQSLTEQAVGVIKNHLSKKQCYELDELLTILWTSCAIPDKFSCAKQPVMQYRLNQEFVKKGEQRIIVTANMSSGKSTLINALIGKQVTRTSQEVCTANVCYIYSKPFEDEHVHLSVPELDLDANEDKLKGFQWDGTTAIASSFAGVACNVPRLCVIDTPGVNAALYREHSIIAHKALLDLKYDKIIYVITPTNLGTNAEIKHLKWVSENIPKEKVIFVLNKLDDYHCSSDSVEESISGLRSDLIKIGFENPIICPVSAYFGLLLKMEQSGLELSEDEQDEYDLLAKKFNKPAYDLSHFYDGVQSASDDDENIRLSKKSGLYGLEKTIYGGTL